MAEVDTKQVLADIESELNKQHIDVAALIQGIQIENPRLYQILMELNGGLLQVQEEIFPLIIKDRVPTTLAPILPAPASFTFAFQPTSVRFFWTQVETAFGYEIREGLLWDTATFRVRTASLQVDLDALLSGSYYFLIKTINSAGEYSEDARSVLVDVPAIGSVQLAREVIDNNVLLRWTVPSSTFRILHYEIAKEGVVIGHVDSTFFSFFENVAGIYTYSVVAIDVAGNRGILAEITVQVSSPPDYALQDKRTSELLGTRFDLIRVPVIPSLVGPWFPTTWEEHFVNNNWDMIQDQLEADYVIYIQPTIAFGSYTEYIDYGVVVSNVIITIAFNWMMHAPEVGVEVQMSTSVDNINYTPWTSGASQYFPSFRYLQFYLNWTGLDDRSLLELWNLTISISVKRENDGGEVYATYTNVTDPGTYVAFTKPFKDVESITCTTKSVTEPFYAIFDFADVPNPPGFSVYVFDSSGNRVKKYVDWKARGIV
jgi:hypothetical protein